MSVLTIDEKQLKDMIKLAVVEVLEERPDLVEEALLDIGLERAIQEAELTPRVSREEIFEILEAE
jgi:hypothetical protein